MKQWIKYRCVGDTEWKYHEFDHTRITLGDLWDLEPRRNISIEYERIEYPPQAWLLAQIKETYAKVTEYAALNLKYINLLYEVEQKERTHNEHK